MATPTGPAAKANFYPYVLFKCGDDGVSRLWVQLAVEVPDAAGKASWSANFFVQAEGQHALAGTDGWVANNRLEESVEMSLKQAINLCFAATDGRLSKEIRKTTVTGEFPKADTPKSGAPMTVVLEDKEDVICRDWTSSYFAFKRGQFSFTD